MRSRRTVFPGDQIQLIGIDAHVIAILPISKPKDNVGWSETKTDVCVPFYTSRINETLRSRLIVKYRLRPDPNLARTRNLRTEIFFSRLEFLLVDLAPCVALAQDS